MVQLTFKSSALQYMKNKLYCFAAGGSALRGCASAAFRRVPELIEKANLIQVVEENRGLIYGAKTIVQSIDSIDFGTSSHNRQVVPSPAYNQSGNHARSIDLGFTDQQKRLDDMMRDIDRSVNYALSLNRNSQRSQQDLAFEEWLFRFQLNRDSCTIDDFWYHPIPIRKGIVFANER